MKVDRTDGFAFHHLWLSPWTLWIGFRYLKSKKSSRFLSFITVLSMLGIGLGVTAMIVVLSVMGGFESELKKRLMTSDQHILLTPRPDVDGFDRGFVPRDALERHDAYARIQENPEVESIWPVVATEAILRTGRKVTGVVLRGINPQRMKLLETQMVEVAESQVLVEQRGGEIVRLPGIIVGQELAYMMGLIPGDRVTLISPTETQGPLEAVPRLKKFVVEGVYSSGIPDQELHIAFTPEKNVHSFIRRKNVVSYWEASVSEFERAPILAKLFREMLPEFRIQDWIQLNSNLFASLKLERIAMFIILAFIIIVASFNIVTTLTLMILEKKKDASILKAMGARHGQVAAIFLAEGVLIGGVGIGGGLLMAWLICSFLKRYELIALPDIYYDRTLPVVFDATFYFGVAICAALIVIVACLYPSRRAAKLHPLEGIRLG